MLRHPRIEVAFCEQQGRRDTMEDTHVVFEQLTNDTNTVPDNTSFFAVYDGHGGVNTANLLRDHLHTLIVSREEFEAGDISGAIQAGFLAADHLVLEASQADDWVNGSTGVIALLMKRRLFIANVGDSEASLVSMLNDTIISRPLTTSHKASDPIERKRIESLGGHVFFNRLFGTLAVSRSFGDSRFKIPKTKQNFVSCEPAIQQVDIGPDCRYLILACDGLWDVMSHQEAADLIHNYCLEGQTAKQIASSLVQDAMQRKTEDNVTVLIVIFQWEQANESEDKANEVKVENEAENEEIKKENEEIKEIKEKEKAESKENEIESNHASNQQILSSFPSYLSFNQYPSHGEDNCESKCEQRETSSNSNPISDQQKESVFDPNPISEPKN